MATAPGAIGAFRRETLTQVVDVAAVYGIAVADPAFSIGVWFGFLGLQTLVAWYAFRLDDESPWPLWSLPLQLFVYRQLMYLVVIQSMGSALYGTRLKWQKLGRTGQLDASPRTTG
jgi:hypothetical protein